mgnify:CR=1 FL=1
MIKVRCINYAYTVTAGSTPFKAVTLSFAVAQFAVAQEFRGENLHTFNIPNVPAGRTAARPFPPKKSAKPLPYLVHLCYNTSIYAAFAAETGG